jgi:hypothetical protein
MELEANKHLITKEAQLLLGSLTGVMDFHEDIKAEDYDRYGPKALIYTLEVASRTPENTYTYTTYVMEQYYDGNTPSYYPIYQSTSPVMILYKGELEGRYFYHHNLTLLIRCLQKQPSSKMELRDLMNGRLQPQMSGSYFLHRIMDVLKSITIVTPWCGELIN